MSIDYKKIELDGAYYSSIEDATRNQGLLAVKDGYALSFLNINFMGLIVEMAQDHIRLTDIKNADNVWVFEKIMPDDDRHPNNQK